MSGIISQVTQLDKDMREKVSALEDELAKLPVFLRDQRKQISAKYEAEAKERVQTRKLEIEVELKRTQELAEKELIQSIADLTTNFECKKDEWIKEVYKDILDNFQGE